jgi:hypothetical protein
VLQDLRAACLVKVSAALIAIVEERRRAALQMITGQLLPLRRPLERLREQRVLLVDKSGRGLPPFMQTSRSNNSLKLVEGPYQLIGQ